MTRASEPRSADRCQNQGRRGRAVFLVRCGMKTFLAQARRHLYLTSWCTVLYYFTNARKKVECIAN